MSKRNSPPASRDRHGTGKNRNQRGKTKPGSNARPQQVAYWQSLPRTGKPTIILDEPERSLSIPAQAKLWLETLPRLTKTFQILSASHSPFALKAPGAHFLSMPRDYVKECQQALWELNGTEAGAKNKGN